MTIQRNPDRNIVNFARKIMGEKLIFERRLWENMRDNKHHEDVAMRGGFLMNSYRNLMLGITSVDLLDTDASVLTTSVVPLDENMEQFLNTLSRFLLLELEEKDFSELLDHIAKAIIFWTTSRGNVVMRDNDNEATEESHMVEAVDLLTMRLSLDIPYVVMILLSDLHYLTYIVNAEQCLEILSST